MDSCPDRLSPLQRELLVAFFAREQRFVLTGGAALAGFYLGHRESQDLDLFARQPLDLNLAERALGAAANDIGAVVERQVGYPEFRRFVVKRGTEVTLVDLVVDRTPTVDAQPMRVGQILVDTEREITANKICTLVGRAELRDLVDLMFLLQRGARLEDALRDALAKDGGADAATLAWLLGELRIAPDARIPGGIDASALERFRADLVVRLRRIAFPGQV